MRATLANGCSRGTQVGAGRKADAAKANGVGDDKARLLRVGKTESLALVLALKERLARAQLSTFPSRTVRAIGAGTLTSTR